MISEKNKGEILNLIKSKNGVSFERLRRKTQTVDNYELLECLLETISNIRIKRNTTSSSIENIEALVSYCKELTKRTLIINKNKIEYLIENCIYKLTKSLNIVKDEKLIEYLELQILNLKSLLEIVHNQSYENDIDCLLDSIIKYINSTNDFFGFKFLFDKNSYLYQIKEIGSFDFLKRIIDIYIEYIDLKDDKKIIYIENVFKFFIASFKTNKQELNDYIDLKINKYKNNSQELEYINDLKKDVEFDHKNNLKMHLLYNNSLIMPEYINNPDYILDLTKKNCITIDLDKAKSLEDALIFEKQNDGTYKVIICISDVNMFVEEDSLIDTRALEIGENIKTKEGLITIFPKNLVSNVCCLNKNNNKNCVAYSFLFDSDFNYIRYEVNNAIINVKNAYYYSDLEKLYKKGDLTPEIEGLILLSKKLEKDNTKLKEYHDKKNKHRNEEIQENVGALIIEQLKVLLNSTHAEYYKEEGLPFIYRNNTNININKAINEIVNNTPNQRIEDVFRSVKLEYGFSLYSNISTGHEGLGKSSYAHVSIPLRNYAAFFNQRMDKKFILNKNFTDKDIYYYENKAKTISKQLNTTISINHVRKTK